MKIVKYIPAIIVLFLCAVEVVFAQKPKRIDIQSGFSEIDEKAYPGATIFTRDAQGQVYFKHEGIEVWGDQAVLYNADNFVRIYGKVKMRQGDSLSMTSKYAEYSGNKQIAFAAGDVFMKSTNSTLTTDTLFFDRTRQEAFYRSGGTVRDTSSVLTSRIGKFFVEKDKYAFYQQVKLTNPEYIIDTGHLEYFPNNGNAYLFGPSTITGSNSVVYCERGFYDTRRDLGYFVKNSRIDYENRKIFGDSLYFERSKSFASASNNIRVIDTINNMVLRGHYAEVFREKDSVMITKRALAISAQEQDSIYIHSDTILITGPSEQRIVRGYYDVKMYKTDMSAKADSLYMEQSTGLTKLMNTASAIGRYQLDRKPNAPPLRPVVWHHENQMTGDTVFLQHNKATEQLDSIFVYDDVFITSLDKDGYNQVKGIKLYGKFKDNSLHIVDIVKNAEVFYYIRDADSVLTGIDKSKSNKLRITFFENDVDVIVKLGQTDGTIYQDHELPKNARSLRGLDWRGDERPLSVEDLFIDERPYTLPVIRGIDLPKDQVPEQMENPKDLILEKRSLLHQTETSKPSKPKLPK
ncbi:MAG: OstA-like protein [Flavobacteriaceae bacterium]|nr:OstA-like protein [Flavobacteriaceae bacterium]